MRLERKILDLDMPTCGGGNFATARGGSFHGDPYEIIRFCWWLQPTHLKNRFVKLGYIYKR